MNFLLGFVLFCVNFYLVIFFLLRAITLPSVLLVVSPTALARRFIRRSSDGKSTWNVNVDARKLNDRLASPKVVVLTTCVTVAGFAISQQFAYLCIAAAMLLVLFGEQDLMDERTFEIWTRALAAVSDAVIVGLLFFTTIFRIQVDAFSLLALMFFFRELLLFFARRWLESEPEFEPYSEEEGFTVGMKSDDEEGKTRTTWIKLGKDDFSVDMKDDLEEGKTNILGIELGKSAQEDSEPQKEPESSSSSDPKKTIT